MLTYLPAEVVVLTNELQGLTGIEVTPELADAGVRVVIVSSDSAALDRARRAGAFAAVPRGDLLAYERALDAVTLERSEDDRRSGTDRRGGDDRRVAQEWTKVIRERRSGEERRAGDRREQGRDGERPRHQRLTPEVTGPAVAARDGRARRRTQRPALRAASDGSRRTGAAPAAQQRPQHQQRGDRARAPPRAGVRRDRDRAARRDRTRATSGARGVDPGHRAGGSAAAARPAGSATGGSDRQAAMAAGGRRRRLDARCGGPWGPPRLVAAGGGDLLGAALGAVFLAAPSWPALLRRLLGRRLLHRGLRGGAFLAAASSVEAGGRGLGPGSSGDVGSGPSRASTGAGPSSSRARLRPRWGS